MEGRGGASREGEAFRGRGRTAFKGVSGDRKGLCTFIDLERQEGERRRRTRRGEGAVRGAGDRAATVGKWLHNTVKRAQQQTHCLTDKFGEEAEKAPRTGSEGREGGRVGGREDGGEEEDDEEE